MAMVSLVRDLLHHGLPCVATRRISQDTLESYFGFQRSHGRRNANTSIHEFGYRRNAIVLKRQLHHTSSSESPLPKKQSR